MRHGYREAVTSLWLDRAARISDDTLPDEGSGWMR